MQNGIVWAMCTGKRYNLRQFAVGIKNKGIK